MRKKKAKIDISPKIFEDYNELWELNASEYYTMPVIKENKIIGYRLEQVEEAEEQYRTIAREFFEMGIDNEKMIKEKLSCPMWLSMNIENRIEDIIKCLD